MMTKITMLLRKYESSYHGIAWMVLKVAITSIMIWGPLEVGAVFMYGQDEIWSMNALGLLLMSFVLGTILCVCSTRDGDGTGGV